MFDSSRKTMPPLPGGLPMEITQGMINFGEFMASMFVGVAERKGMSTHECVLSLPAFIAKVISTMAKDHEGACIEAAAAINGIVMDYANIDENERRARRVRRHI